MLMYTTMNELVVNTEAQKNTVVMIAGVIAAIIVLSIVAGVPIVILAICFKKYRNRKLGHLQEHNGTSSYDFRMQNSAGTLTDPLSNHLCVDGVIYFR